MLCCLVQRKSYGGKQFNKVEVDCQDPLGYGWESTRLLYEAGKLPKAITNEYAYIMSYEPEDWEE